MGFNYGLFVDETSAVENLDDVTFTLGRAGAGAPVAAESSRPFSGP